MKVGHVRLAQRCVGLLMMFALGVDVRGASITRSAFDDYVHTAWTAKDGAPEGAWSIAQTSDGWLWLGGPMGVYRFDGQDFQPIDFQRGGSQTSRSVGRMWATGGGDLWAAHSSSGASVWRARDGQVSAPPGLPPGLSIDGFLEHPDGRFWALSSTRMFQLEVERWTETSFEAMGLPAAGVSYALMQGSELWVSTEIGLMRLRSGGPRFEPAITDATPDALIMRGHDGRLWQNGDRGVAPVAGVDAPDAGVPAGPPVPNTSWGVIDPEGGYWTVACPGDAGVCRIGDAARDAWQLVEEGAPLSVFARADGLSSDVTMAVLVDRDGDVWVGTKSGLDRFHRRAVSTVAFPGALVYFAMLPEPDGSLWLGTASRQSSADHLWRVDDVATAVTGFEGEISAAYRDVDGSILGGGRRGLWRFGASTITAVPVPQQFQELPVQAITRDGAGRLWISHRQSMVSELRGDAWIAKGGIAALPDEPIGVARTDADGRAWFGYYANHVVRLDGARVEHWGEADGIATGTVTAILPGDAMTATLIGGERGLSALRDDRWHALHTLGADRLQGITGLVRSADGTLWINAMSGVVRIAAADLQRAIDDPSIAMPHRLLDTDDGVPGSAQQVRPLPTLVEGTDGRLWVASANGLAWFSPDALSSDPSPPDAQLRGFEVEGVAQPLVDARRLPAGSRRVRISYAALNLAHPRRTGFRYRLEGSDDDWQSAGSRREAIYTNLGPGDYRFTVAAANEDGVWGAASPVLSFTIAPTFVQSWWFVALCALIVATSIALVHALRLRALHARIEERHDERHRIARDLHDTLLQGVQGMLLRMQTWAVDATLPAARREEFDRAAVQARAMLVEGRDRILALREQHVIDDLAERLQALEASASGHPAPSLHVQVAGAPRMLDVIAAEAIHDIAREAVLNAFVHAKARQIEIVIAHARRRLTVSVRDDGCGIDDAIAAACERPGHWGLVGMRERARQLRGTLAVKARAEGGTEVCLDVPARIAYLRPPRWWRRPRRPDAAAS